MGSSAIFLRLFWNDSPPFFGFRGGNAEIDVVAEHDAGGVATLGGDAGGVAALGEAVADAGMAHEVGRPVDAGIGDCAAEGGAGESHDGAGAAVGRHGLQPRGKIGGDGHDAGATLGSSGEPLWKHRVSNMVIYDNEAHFFWDDFEKTVNDFVDSVTLDSLVHKNKEFVGFEYCI